MAEKPIRPCCGSTSCPREHLERLLSAEERTAEHVRQTGRTVASLCRNVSETNLRQCFAQLFGLPAECALGDRFIAAYEEEVAASPPEPVVIFSRRAGGG